MNQNDAIVIVGAARTPMGGFQGELAGQSCSDLGAQAIKGALSFAGVEPAAVDEVIMGCVLSAGQGQAPARQSLIKAGIPVNAAASTLNKMCGSGMKAVMLANDLLRAGSAQVVIAGGMESMSNAPYLLPKARAGLRMGHAKMIDHMFLDGLEDAYEEGRLMGTFAEDCAQEYQFTREAQDAFAIESLTRAQQAIKLGHFSSQTVPVSVVKGKESRTTSTDEQPAKANVEKISTLKPAFRSGGTVTAANSSSISDGAAALVLMRASEAERQGLSPKAKIIAHASFADEPQRFATAPIGALRKLSEITEWSLDSVDLFEINEAFAVVPMAAMQTLGLPHEKVNVNGGACALGHPIGASGARIIVTLLAALEQHGLTRGMAAVCIGGGEATAIAIERIA